MTSKQRTQFRKASSVEKGKNLDRMVEINGMDARQRCGCCVFLSCRIRLSFNQPDARLHRKIRQSRFGTESILNDYLKAAPT